MRATILTKFSFLATFAGLLAVSALAQTPTPTPKPKVDDEVIKISSRLVVVPVSVTDAGGNAVLGLSAQDFQITEEGRQQTLDAIGEADKVPLDIALLFDVSASTDAMFKFEQETAAKFLRDVMRPIDRATIYSIGTKPKMILSHAGAEQAIAAIMSLSPTREATAFFDAVAAASQDLRKNARERTRRVVVMISDGEDTSSESTLREFRKQESKIADGSDPNFTKRGSMLAQAQQAAKMEQRRLVLRSLQDADTVFYSINPGGSSYQLNKISIFGQENMQRFSDETGGSAFAPKFSPIDTKDLYANGTNMRRNTELLDRIFKQIANELRSQYLIQYYSESDFPLNKFVKVNVGVTRGAVRVRAREGYYVKN